MTVTMCIYSPTLYCSHLRAAGSGHLEPLVILNVLCPLLSQLLLPRTSFCLFCPTMLTPLVLTSPLGFDAATISSGKPPRMFHQPAVDKDACVSVL